MLRVFQSNRLEILADELALALARGEAPALESQKIVVQERGVARWLQLELARRQGIAANIEFPFPAGLIWSLFTRVLPQVPLESPFEPDVLVWRFMKWLERSKAASHPRLKHALAEGDARRRYELAQRLAQVFDRYLVYRPQWMQAWSEDKKLGLGPDEAWQAAFWRELSEELRPDQRKHPKDEFFAALEKDMVARAALPQSLHLFAIQALPPMYVDIFRRLAEWIDIHLYVLNPCEEHWGDIVTNRELALQAAQNSQSADLHFEVGNALLASLGRQGRTFIDSLSEA